MRNVGVSFLSAVVVFAVACGRGGDNERGASDEEAVRSLIERYYFLVRNAKYEEIPGMRSSKALGEEGADEFVANMKEVCSKLGSLESYEPVDLTRSGGVGGGLFLATYDVRYANGGTREVFTIVKEGGAYKISKFNMHSIRFVKR